jgi:MoaA/NifB/PqqE/SkfB family radical SAM enzyme
VRLTYDGSFESCRWAKSPQRTNKFPNTTLLEYYNSNQLKAIRQDLLQGRSLEMCSNCHYEESFNKINGRLRQLNKSAIDVDNFDLTLRSSPHYENFLYSYENQGLANLSPVDLQIELGNICNSACIMCTPEASSKLASDYVKLNEKNPTLFAQPSQYTAWNRDPKNLQQFIDELVNIPNLRYIHFLGGETLYEESFYTICEHLIEKNIAKNIIIGTTTNGTIYNTRIEKFIQNFKQFHLGISIESVSELNDYIRWPSQIQNVLENVDSFLQLRKSNPGLYISLRITPNIFTISQIDQLFLYMIENQVIAESCNILSEPECLRMELLPDDLRAVVKDKLSNLIEKYNLYKENVINVRRSDQISQVTANTVVDYYKFICDYEQPHNIEKLRYDLVSFIKTFESIRNNSILHYVPSYEKFLRHYGY